MNLKASCCCVSQFCFRNLSGSILNAAVQYGAYYLKYDDNGYNLFIVKDRFHVDIEQICKVLILFGVAPWKNGISELGYDDGPFCNEDQTDMWGWDLWQKKEWSAVDDDRSLVKNTRWPFTRWTARRITARSRSWIREPKVPREPTLEGSFIGADVPANLVAQYFIVIRSRSIYIDILNLKYSYIVAFIHILTNVFDGFHRTAELNINMIIECSVQQRRTWYTMGATIVPINICFVDISCEPPFSVFLRRYIRYPSTFVIVSLVKSLGKRFVLFPPVMQSDKRFRSPYEPWIMFVVTISNSSWSKDRISVEITLSISLGRILLTNQIIICTRGNSHFCQSTDDIYVEPKTCNFVIKLFKN